MVAAPLTSVGMPVMRGTRMFAASEATDGTPWVDAQPGGVGVIVSWKEPTGHIRLASAGSDRTVRVWDPQAGVAVGAPLIGHTAVVGALTAWTSSDGTARVASASEDHTIRIWNPSAGTAQGDPLEGHSEWVMGLTSWRTPQGGSRLASASIDGTVRIWDAETGTPVGGPLTGHTAGLWAVTSFALPDGSVWLASGGDDGTIRIWDPDTGAPVRDPISAHAGGLLGLMSWAGPNGEVRLASGAIDGTVGFWDAATGTALDKPAPRHSAAVRALTCWRTVDGDVRLASAAADGTIRIWDGATCTPIGSPLNGHSGWMPAITSWVGADGAVRLASAGNGGTIRIWSPDTGADVATPLVGHTAGMWAVTSWVRTDGSARVASGGDDAIIRIWDPDTGAAVGVPLTGHTAGLWALTSWRAADGGARLASAGDDGTIRIWDPDAGTQVGPPLASRSGWVPALTNWIAADGTRRLASGGTDGAVRIWDSDNGELLRELTGGDRAWVLALTAWISDDGTPRLAAGDNEGTIRVWDPEAGVPIGEPLTGHTAWVRSLTSWTRADGNCGIASVSFDGTVRVWDPQTGAPVGEALTGHTARIGALTSWIGTDGAPRLASGSDDDTVRIWDPDAGLPVGSPLTGHTSGVWALTSWTSPATGPRLASTGYDGTVRLWNPETGVAIRTIEVGPVALWGLSDAPTRTDALGRLALAGAIADQVYRPSGGEASDGSGPTVVSVEGPWGCGKSTLMGMVRERLREHPRHPDAPRQNAHLTVRNAVRQIQRYSGQIKHQPTDISSPTRGVVTAWFNPWAHQSGEQVWAGLVNEIIDTAGTVLYPTEAERERYWFARNLDRIDRFALRRTLLRRIVSPLLGVGLVAVAAPLILTVAELNGSLRVFGHNWSTVGVALAGAIVLVLTGAAHTMFQYWRGRAAHYLSGELFHIPITDGITAPDLTGSADTFVDPLRRARAGSLYLLQHDVGDLLADLGAAGYQMVVFVDDLDRCRTDTTAEVFEAVNLFLSSVTTSKGLRARFVIGLDPAVVAAHLDAYSSSHTSQAALYGDDVSPGWAFLRKLVQLPVIVPQVSDDAVRRFVKTVTNQTVRTTPPGVHSAHADAPVTSPPRNPAPAARRPWASPTAGMRVDTAVPVERTRTETHAWRTLEQHPGISSLIVERLTAQPERSVRESKRLLNVWQLYERVLSSTEPLSLASAAIGRARHLVLLAEIVTRWPALQRWLHRHVDGQRGLRLLAEAVDDDQQWHQAVERLQIPSVDHEAALTHLRQLLRDYDGLAIADLASRVL